MPLLALAILLRCLSSADPELRETGCQGVRTHNGSERLEQSALLYVIEKYI